MKKIILYILLFVSITLNIGFIIQNDYITLAYHETRSLIHDCLVFAGLRKKVKIPVYSDDAIVYFANGSKVSLVLPLNKFGNFSSASGLPNHLIIKPGLYEYYGNLYRLDTPGVYRFMKPYKDNSQRIVFKKGEDVQVLLSSLAWIITHGYRDDAKSFNQWMQIAKTRKLSLICIKVAELTRQVLTQEGYRVRLVQTATLEPRTGYNDLHVMDEVYIPKYKKWVLFDVDNGVYFTHKGNMLSLLELIKYAQKKDYRLNFIANDTRLDIANYYVMLKNNNRYSFAFLAEWIDADLKLWYKRVVQVGIINTPKKAYFTTDNETVKRYVTKYYPWFTYMPKKRFINIFYG